jgi:two-component system chemotaxis response regulator CheY
VAQNKVLIIDDSPTMRGLLRFAIQRLPDATIAEAGDGIEGARILEQETFDLILLDVNMPGMNGLQLLERIRKDDRFAATRVIMITTEGSEMSQQEAKKLGADGYLPKPIRAQQLIETVKFFLS